MPYQPQPADAVYTAPRYPAPDWEAIGTVSRVYVPDDDGRDGTVGYLVRQGTDRLAFIAWVDPTHLGYGIRRHVARLLRDGAAAGVSVDATWALALADTLHTPPNDQYLPALLADIRSGE